MKQLFTMSLLFAVVLSWQSVASASEKLSGVFTVNKACKAYSSIRKQSNPITLTVGQQYKVVAKNKPSPTHYRIVVGSSGAKNNWVAVNCGTLKGQAVGTAPATTSTGKNYLLALSWQPGFCLTHSSKKECKAGTSASHSASHLSLHGLWPQPRNNAYCGVDEATKSIDRRGRWDLLKPLTLSASTKRDLNKVMPGFASQLQRHEWIKHGTCYSSTAEKYYKDSIRLTQQINKTDLAALFTQHKGKIIKLKDIRQSLAKSVGDKAASSVALRCGRKNQVTEIWIGLQGDVATTPISTLMAKGDTPSSNCQSGLVAKY